MCDVNSIKKYILYLKNECDLSITIHPQEKENIVVPSELITFNIHDNSYCVYVKTFDVAHNHCVERLCKVHQKGATGSYCGVCYAGVKEYVYPFRNGDSVVGFISVSGYQSECPDSYIERTSKNYSIPIDNLRTAYSSLKCKMPEKSYVDTLIYPLISMLELAYIRNGEEKEETWLDGVIRYVKQYHTQDITLDHLCDHFGCSRSRISHIFKSTMGVNFREYLTDLRLTDAESLLKYSDLTVTEIAYSVGFCDSNYFSSVFKKRYQISPKRYRQKYKVI